MGLRKSRSEFLNPKGPGSFCERTLVQPNVAVFRARRGRIRDAEAAAGQLRRSIVPKGLSLVCRAVARAFDLGLGKKALS